MGFLIVESKRELENYVNSTKEIWGYRRGTAMRNIIISEDHWKAYSYPLLVTVQSAMDHHGRFHTTSIACGRRTAKRLVYWKTSKNRPLDRSSYLTSFMFYVVENEEYLTEYLDKLGQDFYRTMGGLAKRVDNYEIVIDDRMFDGSRKEPMKLIKANKEPFMIGSLKVGSKDSSRENRINYFLKHYIIQLRDAKKLIYWKKDHLKNSETATHFTYHGSNRLLADSLPRIRPSGNQPRRNGYTYGDVQRGRRERELGQDTPEPPEHGESNVEEVPNDPAERTIRPPSLLDRPPLYRPNARPTPPLQAIAAEVITTNTDTGRIQTHANGEGLGTLDIEDTESLEDSVVETTQQVEEESLIQQINNNTEPDVHRVAVYGQVDEGIGRAGDIDERLRRGGGGEEEEIRAREENIQAREEAVQQAINRARTNNETRENDENTEDWREVDRAIDQHEARLSDETSEDNRDDEASEDNRDSGFWREEEG